MSHPSGAEGAIAAGFFGLLSWVAAVVVAAICIVGIAFTLRKPRGSSPAIVIASIFVAIGSLWSLILLLLFFDGWKDPGPILCGPLFLPPMLGLLAMPAAWLMVAIRRRA
ncbi:MAG: hypothetical protein ACXWUG_24280 [Polyangiales bacterium]